MCSSGGSSTANLWFVSIFCTTDSNDLFVFSSNLVDLEGGRPLADQLNSSSAAPDKRDRTVDGEALETIWCKSLLSIS